MMEKEYIGARNRLLPMLIIVKDNKFGRESVMLTIPSAAEQLFLQFSITFTQPTFQRILLLAIGAVLTMGRRTVTVVLWTIRTVINGHGEAILPDQKLTFEGSEWLWVLS